MNAYFDTSILLRLLLGQPDALKEWTTYENLVGSVLVEVESLRAMDRLRWTREITEDQCQEYRNSLYQFLETMELVEISPVLLRRAGGFFPASIGTLDAIHLATAMAWQDEKAVPLLVATHDRTFGRVARSMGFKTVGF